MTTKCVEDPKHIAQKVNFFIILGAAFACVDPECTKKIDNLTVFFVLLRYARITAACRMLIKLTPGLL